MGELDGTQCDGDGQKMVTKCSNLEKKKEKNKMGSSQMYKT
jgi:hypothetical protein